MLLLLGSFADSHHHLSDRSREVCVSAGLQLYAFDAAGSYALSQFNINIERSQRFVAADINCLTGDSRCSIDIFAKNKLCINHYSHVLTSLFYRHFRFSAQDSIITQDGRAPEMLNTLAAEVFQRKVNIVFLLCNDIDHGLHLTVTEDNSTAMVRIFNAVIYFNQFVDEVSAAGIGSINVGQTCYIARVTYAEAYVPVVLRFIAPVFKVILISHFNTSVVTIAVTTRNAFRSDAVNSIRCKGHYPKGGQIVTGTARVNNLIGVDFILPGLIIVESAKAGKASRVDLFITIEEGSRHLLAHSFLMCIVFIESIGIAVLVELHQSLINLCNSLNTAGSKACLASAGFSRRYATVNNTPCNIRQTGSDKRFFNAAAVAGSHREYFPETIGFGLQLYDLRRCFITCRAILLRNIIHSRQAGVVIKSGLCHLIHSFSICC
nr:MAG TPA: hypothetical protein [Caudoviricetes sp.]